MRIIGEIGRPLSIPEILQASSKLCPSIGIATVYRNVKSLVEDDWLVAVEVPGALVCYERAGQDHHHHFLCKKCNRVFDVHECGLNLQKLVPSGFRMEEHDVVLSGRCEKCAARSKR